jgi:hypothetical protein
MTGHHGHILQMTFPTFITDRTIVGVIGHEPFHDILSELVGLTVFQGDPRTISGRFHTCHDQFTLLILFILVFCDRTLPAGTHRSQGGMPAEIGQVITE